ncbi:MAG: SpoIIE family protein phosphatase [Syntrophothermus sp.]
MDREVEVRRYLEAQRALAARLIDGESLEDVCEDFLSIVGTLLGWEAAAMWEAVQDAPALRFVCGWSGPGFDAAPLWRASRELVFRPGFGLPGRVWASGTTERTADTVELTSRRFPRLDVARRLGLRGAMAIPIVTGSAREVVAVAEFHTREFVGQSEQLTEVVEGSAEQLGSFVARRRDEARNRAVEADAEQLRGHLAELVASSQDAVISKDLRGVITSWNPAAERLYGYSAEEAIGRHISFIVPPDHKNEEERILDVIRGGGRLDTYETDRIRKDGARIAISLTVSPLRGSDGNLAGASVIARDITSERRRRKAKDFLLAASRLLDTSLDPDHTARTIVETAVPELAEICVIDFRRADGTYGDSVVAGVDPAVAAELERIRRAAPLSAAGDHPVAQVIREGRPMVWRDLTAPEVIEDVAQSDDHRRLIEDAGYNSAAVVPLVARGRTMGALSFLHARGDSRYDPGDLELLGELGLRAALALDNAFLYRERDRIARNLQRGLRPPEPAEVPGLEISVVFQPAGQGIEIGGDFYDVLPTDDGCWLLVGDVAGKGSAAAGVSVAVRHAVRGLTRELEDPSDVIARVNELLVEGESLNDFATLILARLVRDDDWLLTLVCAGHPPAIHLHGGDPAELGGGTMLGGWEDPRLARHEATVAPGDTLVFCTDGWLEAGPTERHADPEALAASVAALGDLETDRLAERLAAQAVSRAEGEVRDDLLVLAARPA